MPFKHATAMQGGKRPALYRSCCSVYAPGQQLQAPAYLEGKVALTDCSSCLILGDALVGQVDAARLEVCTCLILGFRQLLAHFVLYFAEVYTDAGVLALLTFPHGW